MKPNKLYQRFFFQKTATQNNHIFNYQERKQHLKKLIRVLKKNANELATALSEDFWTPFYT